MFRKLQVRMTFFCTLIIGCILLTMTFFCLLISESSLKKNHYANFRTNGSSLLLYIDNQSIISHTWLAQMESNYQMAVYIQDGDTPLFYENLHAHEAFQEPILLAKEIAEKQYHLTPDSIRSSQMLIPQQTFRFRNSQRETYYATAAFIPKGDSYLQVILLSSAKLPQNQLMKQRLLFGIGAGVCWILLSLFSWLFIRHMLDPMEKNHQKQVQFVAAASHELRAPLTVILSSLSAARTASADEQIRFFDNMESEGQRMARLIQDMLTLAGSDSQTWQLNPTAVEPDTLLLDTYEKYELLAREKKLHLGITLPDSPVPSCFCDRERIAQTLSVLIDNALSYTPEGGCVMLSLITSARACTFLVRDDGPGIEEEDRERIFDRFYRSDASHHERDHFGLGLSIAREIVRLHKGTIRVENNPEGGCTFFVTLPFSHVLY